MIIREQLFSLVEIEKIKQFIILEEGNIKKIGPSVYPGTSSDSLTGRFPFYNFLNSNIGTLIKNKLFPFLDKLNFIRPLSIQCWANTFRKGEGINIHKHSNNNLFFYCANIFISGNKNIGTIFVKEDKHRKFENNPGEIMLFDSQYHHLVQPNTDEEIRISMALDIHENKKIIDNKRFYIYD